MTRLNRFSALTIGPRTILKCPDRAQQCCHFNDITMPSSTASTAYEIHASRQRRSHEGCPPFNHVDQSSSIRPLIWRGGKGLALASRPPTCPPACLGLARLAAPPPRQAQSDCVAALGLAPGLPPPGLLAPAWLWLMSPLSLAAPTHHTAARQPAYALTTNLIIVSSTRFDP